MVQTTVINLSKMSEKTIHEKINIRSHFCSQRETLTWFLRYSRAKRPYRSLDSTYSKEASQPFFDEIHLKSGRCNKEIRQMKFNHKF